MSTTIANDALVAAMQRTAEVLTANRDYFTELDQAMGDGDMGISMGKVGAALTDYLQANPVGEDVGQFIAKAGMAVNKAAPSTMGTLIATAFMRAGKEVKGKAAITSTDLAAMFTAADQGMQERGKAKPGDKTIIDAIHPAAQTFAQAIESGASLAEAGQQALSAAEAGRDQVTPLRSKIGRASWVGERTEGKLDPGCAMFCLVLAALVES
jgi:dihydroxyacetone kinase